MNVERAIKWYISDCLPTTRLTSCARTRWRTSCWSGWRHSAPCGPCRRPPREWRWGPWARWFRRRPSSRRKRRCRSAWCWHSCSFRRRSASTCPCQRRTHTLAVDRRVSDIRIKKATFKSTPKFLICLEDRKGIFKRQISIFPQNWLKTFDKILKTKIPHTARCAVHSSIQTVYLFHEQKSIFGWMDVAKCLIIFSRKEEAKNKIWLPRTQLNVHVDKRIKTYEYIYGCFWRRPDCLRFSGLHFAQTKHGNNCIEIKNKNLMKFRSNWNPSLVINCTNHNKS